MKYYDDIENKRATYLSFIIFQGIMLLIVYGFVYTSFIAVKLAAAKYSLTFMVYLPVLLALGAYPVILYKSTKIFQKEMKIRAVGWVMGWATLIIVGLYLHLSKIMTL